MPPYRGQGANHAIEDVHRLVQVVKKIANMSNLGSGVELQAELIKKYSDEVATRGAEETLQSIKNGRMLMAYYNFKESPYFRKGLSRE